MIFRAAFAAMTSFRLYSCKGKEGSPVKTLRPLLTAAIALCMALIVAVSYRSIKEIDNFKSSYPAAFTVEEAFYASLSSS